MIVKAGFTIEDASYSDDQISAKYVLRTPRDDALLPTAAPILR
jgi:hypothetical protein